MFDFIRLGTSVYHNKTGRGVTIASPRVENLNQLCMSKVKVTGQDQIKYFFPEHNLHILQPIIKSLGTNDHHNMTMCHRQDPESSYNIVGILTFVSSVNFMLS